MFYDRAAIPYRCVVTGPTRQSAATKTENSAVPLLQRFAKRLRADHETITKSCQDPLSAPLRASSSTPRLYPVLANVARPLPGAVRGWPRATVLRNPEAPP
jgi:hypothetical protein